MMRSTVNVLFWLALCAWIGAIMTVAISATMVFTTLPSMGITLDEYRSFDHTPPGAHGRLAAGQVMDRIFSVVDVVQWIAAPMLIVTIIARWIMAGLGSRLIVNALLALCVIAATATLAWQTLSLGPRMDRHLHAYWAAAKAGDVAAAREHQAAFDQLHPVASTLYQFRLGMLVVTLAIAAAAGSSRATSSNSGDTPRP